MTFNYNSNKKGSNYEDILKPPSTKVRLQAYYQKTDNFFDLYSNIPSPKKTNLPINHNIMSRDPVDLESIEAVNYDSQDSFTNTFIPDTDNSMEIGDRKLSIEKESQKDNSITNNKLYLERNFMATDMVSKCIDTQIKYSGECYEIHLLKAKIHTVRTE